MIPNQQVASDSGSSCPVCGGTGWEVRWEAAEGYPKMLEFARPCPKCRGERRSHDRTGIPLQFYDADVSKFKFETYETDVSRLKALILNFFNSWERWRSAGKGLYLWSTTPGSGKTFLACSLARSLMVRYDLKMRFITAPDYLDLVGNSYKRQQGAPDESQIFRSCDLLVLDDLGAQKSGEWQGQELFRLINERMENGGITLFTSNESPEKMHLDSRTIDRILKASVVLQMPEEGIRQKRAQEEQQNFIRQALGY